jgi:hypothetical protein
MVASHEPPLGRFPFEALFEINERCLELMVQVASGSTRGMHPLLYGVRGPLSQLTPAARRRAARSRILLVNIRFQDVGYWKTLTSVSQRPTAPNKIHACFPRRTAADLSRSILTLAWHALLASPEVAGLVFGMHREVAKIISDMRIADLEQIAKSQFDELTPRWADLSMVWKDLLHAAQENTPNVCRIVALHSLQLAATED